MIKYVFICAAGHSGSTLLDLILGSNEKAVSLGEITYLPKNIALGNPCMCGKLICNCTLWGAAIKKLNNENNLDIVSNPYRFNLGYVDARTVTDRSHQTPIYNIVREIFHGLQYLYLRYGMKFIKPLLYKIDEGLHNNFILYDAVKAVSGCSHIIDSSKTYLKAIGIYQKRPDEVRVIHLIRDGRAVFYSGLRRKMSRADSIEAWKSHYQRAIPLMKKHIDLRHILRVKYEDLVSNPGDQVQKICNFIGLEYEESMLDFSKFEHHLINGNNMKYSSTKIVSDTGWSEKLSDDDRRYFEAKAGTLNQYLGYEPG